jgi:NDP-sugar pyrophosphorylase family protein
MAGIGAVLFAAGRGERLRPLTDAVPKPALPVLDVPLGGAALRALAGTAPPVVVNVSHLGTEVLRALKPFVRAGAVEALDEGAEPYGTAGTLRALRDRVEQRVLTCNADLLSDLEPAALLATHERLGAPATVAVRPVEAGADLVPDVDVARRFVDRRCEPERAGVAFLGMAVFERATLGLLPEERPAGLGEALLRPLVARGELALHLHHGYAADVGTPSRFLEVSLDVLGPHGPLLPATPPGRIVDTPEGRAYVGPGARARPASLGAGAVLLAGAELDPQAWVERAIVWRDERVTGRQRVTGVVRACGRDLI